jgi:hypothetical protein
MRPDEPRPLEDREQAYAIKTWRYLRVAMVGLVLGLAASIAIELEKNGFCWQTSISAYYYTPVRAFFVATLVGIGTALFCLKGSTEPEDIVLNLAGMLAPFVAFVPTTDPNDCSSVSIPSGLDANIDNNVAALLAIGLLAALALAVLRRGRLLQRPVVFGYLAAAAVWLVLAGWFWGGREHFDEHAHLWTAVAFFVCIFAGVWINAFGHKQPVRSVRNPYTRIGALMAVTAIVIFVADRLGWRHSMFAIEAVFIVLFIAFWLIQTRELWDDGLRPPANASGS